MCEEQSPRATASSGGGRLGARVPPSDHDHIEVRAARSGAVAAEATRGQAFAEGRRGPAATVPEKEHAEGGQRENPKQLGERKPAGRRHLALRQNAARLRPASPLIGGWSRIGRGVARAGGFCAFSSCRDPMPPAGDSALKVEVRPFRWASLYSQVAIDKQ